MLPGERAVLARRSLGFRFPGVAQHLSFNGGSRTFRVLGWGLWGSQEWSPSYEGCLLALLKYPFYPLFNFDNGMNLISKSLTILTLAQLLVVCTYILEVLRFCRFLTNFGAWNGEAHDHAMIRRMTKAKARTKDRRPWWLEARSCTSTLQWSPKDKAHKMRSRYFGAKQSKEIFKEGFSSLSFSSKKSRR